MGSVPSDRPNPGPSLRRLVRDLSKERPISASESKWAEPVLLLSERGGRGQPAVPAHPPMPTTERVRGGALLSVLWERMQALSGCAAARRARTLSSRSVMQADMRIAQATHAPPLVVRQGRGRPSAARVSATGSVRSVLSHAGGMDGARRDPRPVPRVHGGFQSQGSRGGRGAADFLRRGRPPASGRPHALSPAVWKRALPRAVGKQLSRDRIRDIVDPDAYWTERFRVDKMRTPAFFEQWVGMIYDAGKYVNVLQEMGRAPTAVADIKVARGARRALENPDGKNRAVTVGRCGRCVDPPPRTRCRFPCMSATTWRRSSRRTRRRPKPSWTCSSASTG